MVHHLDERHIFLFLVQVFLLLGSTKLLGILFQKWRQPTITADILVGVLLGPSVLGRLLPSVHAVLFPADTVQRTMLETIAWTGILFLLLDTGLEVNFSSVWRQRDASIRISLSDIFVPILIAFIPLYLLLPSSYLVDPSNRLLFSLFLATIMTISAMPVAIRALHELGILKTDMGFLIVSALAFNDIVGWVLFTVILGVFTEGRPDFASIVRIVGLTLGFTVFALTLGRRLVDRSLGLIRSSTEERSGMALTVAALFGLLFGAITNRIGIHSLFGFFIAGLVAGESRNLSEKDRQAISRMVYAVFVPIFFANIGLKVDFIRRFDLFLFLFITLIGVSGRLLGAWIGAVLARAPASNRLPIAIAHTPGGEMHIVVSLLALEYGLITETVFVAVVCAAVFSSILMGPWMAWTLRQRREIGLKTIFRQGLTLIPVTTASRDEALAELAAEAGHRTGQDPQTILRGLLERENTMSTAVENGIALPHTRLPGLVEPVVLAAHSFKGIEWDSPDGKPARWIFLILTPEDDPDIQIRILSTLARKLKDPAFAGRLTDLKAGDSLAPLADIPA